MEEEANKLETLKSEPRQGSGSMLAAARKQQQKTIEEIAQELNLSVTQIKTIELDQTEGLPEPTYVRGYIRSYAKLLGLQPEEVLHNYLNPDWQKTSSLNDIPRGIAAAEESSPGFFTSKKMMVLIILALIVTALWYYGALDGVFGSRSQSNTGSLSDASSSNTAVLVPSAGEIVASTRESPVAASEENQPSSDTNSSTLNSVAPDDSASAASASESETDQEVTEVSSAPAENVLLMNFTETSWVDIRDANDDRLAYKSYAQGEELEVREAGVLKVFIGNAAGVNVTLNEEPFDIEAHREGVYAKFVIDPSQ